MMSNVNTLMHLEADGTSRFNALGSDISDKVFHAVNKILNDAIEENGPIDIRMFAHVAQDAVQVVNLMKQF